MRERIAVMSKDKLLTGMAWTVCVFVAACCASGQNSNERSSSLFTDVTTSVELVKHEKEFSSARVEPARMGEKAGIAVIFEGTDDLHYYANAKTSPAPGSELKVEAKSDDFTFGQALFPKGHLFTDMLNNKIEVYAGHFTVFIPITAIKAPTKTTVIDKGNIEVKISGIPCTSKLCLLPVERTLQTKIDWSQRDSWKHISAETGNGNGKTVKASGYSIPFALGLAFLAGLAINIMPCVWPILPLIVMRIVEQAKAGRRQAVAMGFSFGFGIFLFFACFAVLNAILRMFYATVLELSDPFRNSVFVIVLAMILVVMALFMFGAFTISVPSAVASKSGSGKGYTGAVGTGFLAAIMGTPCSFGILGAAMGWAQSQTVWLGTLAIMVIGVGMAVPYAILTLVPGLLKKLPKAGQWMELFKQGIGFILLIVAVWLIGTLAQEQRINVLYFALALSFCVWMWGGWVSYNTAGPSKWTIRTIAVLLVVLAGLFFLMPSNKAIDWKNYDGGLIDTTLEESRPVLIEFTADWCLSCKVVERFVYSRQDIAALIEEKDVLAIKADTTANSPATIALKNVYNEPGVPVSILLVPNREQTIKWHGKLFADELKAALEKLPSKKQ